jgi:hypothetical protein
MPDFCELERDHDRIGPTAGIERGASIRASFRKERHAPQPLPENMPNTSA